MTPACIVAVHDGDTITLCDHTRVRLANIDAPELAGSPRCAPGRVRQLAHSRNPAWCDYRRGQIARDALARLLASGPPMLWPQGTDRYGRTLARVTVNGIDAGRYLIARNLARPWQ